MRVSFLRPIDQFDGTHRFLEELKSALQSADYKRLQFSVAFAKSGPLLHLLPLLKQWKQPDEPSEIAIGEQDRFVSLLGKM